MTQDLSDSYESLAALFNISALLATSLSFDEFLHGVLLRLRNLLATDLVYARLPHPKFGWRVHFNRATESVTAPLEELSALEETVWTGQRLLSYEDPSTLPPDEPLRI
ncbi:MAG: hypothetical protein J6386_14535 [Candidatus Synoicihabitans palmerolidicus]|nr:hypothetical protein [Candidatus Synoicihabitans palmerolidicus]